MSVEIREEDLKFETWPPRPEGGQHVGTYGRGVKITHVPTGTIVTSTDERSQHANRMSALRMLRAALEAK